jgi:hypothetical protein
MATARAPKGYGLLVGLTEVDPRKYNGWDGKSGCWGCIKDTDQINEILTRQGYAHISRLNNKDATAEKVLGELQRLAKVMEPGDMLTFYYSGHGGQVPDLDGDDLDRKDETLCCYNRQLIDDELGEAWALFKPGVRIFMLSDSCHSGTNDRNLSDLAMGTRTMLTTLWENLSDAAYDAIERAGSVVSALGIAPHRAERTPIKAMVAHIGACVDHDTSRGDYDGGTFTKALVSVYRGGAFGGNHKALCDAINVTVGTSAPQRANLHYLPAGPAQADPKFVAYKAQKAFALDGAAATASREAEAASVPVHGASAHVMPGAPGSSPAPATTEPAHAP